MVKRNYRVIRRRVERSLAAKSDNAVTTFSNYKSNLNEAYHERGRWPSRELLLINAIRIYGMGYEESEESTASTVDLL